MPVDQMMGKFDDHADHIREQYKGLQGIEARARSLQSYVAPWDTAENFLKREAYLLISNFLETEGGRNAIKKIIKGEKKIPRAPLFSDNPFYWGLLAIDPQQDVYNKAKISLYAPLLKYAYDHGVSPANLIGFLFQVGRPADVRRKFNAKQCEVDFKRVREQSRMER